MRATFKRLPDPAAGELHLHWWPDRKNRRGRDLTREALGCYVSRPDILRMKSGRLELRQPDWHLSVSHKHRAAAVLISAMQPVGIDLEKLTDRRYSALAGHYFHPEEANAIRTAGDPGELFYALWTRKESLAKITDKSIFKVVRSNMLGVPVSREIGAGFTGLQAYPDIIFQTAYIAPGFLLSMATSAREPAPRVARLSH